MTRLTSTLHVKPTTQATVKVANTAMDTRRLTVIRLRDAADIDAGRTADALVIQTTAMSPTELADWLRQLALQVEDADIDHDNRMADAPRCDRCSIQSHEVQTVTHDERGPDHGVAGTEQLCRLCAITADNEIAEVTS